MKHEHLTYHQWRGEPRDQESPPTDNDPWECLLRTNANLGREVSELKKQRDVLSSQLQGVIVACHLRGYHVGDSLGEWIEKQFADALTLSAPPVVPVEDVKPLVDAIDSLNNAARFTVLIGEGLTELDAAQGAVDSALSTFTAKHKL